MSRSDQRKTTRNFAKANRELKREGNKRFRRNFKQPRYSKCPFWGYKTKRTFWYYY